MSNFLIVLIICLATFRLTRIITTDAFPFAELRESFVKRWGTYDDAPDKNVSISGKSTNWRMRKLAYLWECNWCASVWVSVFVVGLTIQVASVPLPALVALAASAVTGLIAQKQPD